MFGLFKKEKSLLKIYENELKLIKEYNEDFKIRNFNKNDILKEFNDIKKMFQGLDYKNDNDLLKIKDLLEDKKNKLLGIILYVCENKLLNEKDNNGKIWNIVPYDIQLISILETLKGKVLDISTGEGKTIIAGISGLIFSIVGYPIYIFTQNGYLANRDVLDMSILFDFFGLTYGYLDNTKNYEERIELYKKDILYISGSEIMYDYLRNNQIFDLDKKFNINNFIGIIDEVDYLLIDDAVTPITLSDEIEDDTLRIYGNIYRIIKDIPMELLKIDKGSNTIIPTNEGLEKIEKNIGIENLYSNENWHVLRVLNACLKARFLLEKDKDYIIDGDFILLIDSDTGRIINSRLKEGIHQALEAKEGLSIKKESVVIDQISYKTYFNKFKILSGMSGSSYFHKDEFLNIYGLDTIKIPENKENIRKDLSDLLFNSKEDKNNYLVELVKEVNKKQQPLLIGTLNINQSIEILDLLKNNGIENIQLLNTKNLNDEDIILSNSGKKGRITIVTNIAGRGVDIKIDDEVNNLGGLYIIGYERGDSRRVDNQLRGRTGRQGKNGITRFLVSTEDYIIKNYGGDMISPILNNKFLKKYFDGGNLEINKLGDIIDSIQRKIEGIKEHQRFGLYVFDSILDEQREVINSKRNNILDKNNFFIEIIDIIKERVELSFLDNYKNNIFNIEGFLKSFKDKNFLNTNENFIILNNEEFHEKKKEEILDILNEKIIYFIKNENGFDLKEISIIDHNFIKNEILNLINILWKNFLIKNDLLKNDMLFYSYSGKDSLVEFQNKTFHLFLEMNNFIDINILKILLEFKKEK